MHWLVLLTGVTPMIVEYQPVQCTRSVRSGPGLEKLGAVWFICL
jgi:hypothetical protein